MAEGLTANLRFELERTNQTFSRWCETKEDWLDTSDTRFRTQMEECAYTISALQENERQIEDAREYNNTVKEQQREEVERYMNLTERLRQQKKELERQISTSEVEEEREEQRYEVSRQEYDRMQAKMEQSVNDLTQGIKLYLSLGLEFHKTEGDCMKFIFTQIDPADPARQFFFTMYVDEHDKYNLVETSPRLDGSVCQRLVNSFNVENSIGRFVCKMRAEFAKLV